MTEEMYANLQRLTPVNATIPSLIRAYIRSGLDNQAEIAGSRRHFSGRFRDEVRGQRLEFRWYLTVLVALLAQGLSYLILALYPQLNESDRKQFSGPALLRAAIAQVAEGGHRIQEQVDALIADQSLGEDIHAS
jgi:hypothetical protein